MSTYSVSIFSLYILINKIDGTMFKNSIYCPFNVHISIMHGRTFCLDILNKFSYISGLKLNKKKYQTCK